MRIIQVACLSALLAFGCSTSEVSSKRALTPNWKPLLEGSTISVDVNHPYHPHEMKLSNGMLLRSSDWDGYFKTFVLGLPVDMRDIVLDGLTRYYFEYDKVDRLIKFEPLRYMSEPYSDASYVSAQGSIEGRHAMALLKVKYYGSDWIFANRIKVVADGFTWESPALQFKRDHTTMVWEYAFLDLAEPLIRSVVDSITKSQVTIVRFRGDQYYYDLNVTQRMKNDLAALLNALDAIRSDSK